MRLGLAAGFFSALFRGRRRRRDRSAARARRPAYSRRPLTATIALAAALGLLAGVLTGFFGVGGGILFVPTLAPVVGELEAEATSLAAVLPAVAAGGWQQQRYGNVRWRAAAIVGAASVAGVEADVRAADALSEDVRRRLFALLMFGVAAHLAIRTLRS